MGFCCCLLPKMLDMIERVFYNKKALEWVNPVGGPHSFLIFSASLRACKPSGRQPVIGCLPLALLASPMEEPYDASMENADDR